MNYSIKICCFFLFSYFVLSSAILLHLQNINLFSKNAEYLVWGFRFKISGFAVSFEYFLDIFFFFALMDFHKLLHLFIFILSSATSSKRLVSSLIIWFFFSNPFFWKLKPQTKFVGFFSPRLKAKQIQCRRIFIKINQEQTIESTNRATPVKGEKKKIKKREKK